MKTGNVKIPGALIATDDKGIVAYAGDINDEVTRILDEEESIVEVSQHEINLELISWKDTMTKRDPDNPDLDNYYTISEIDNLLNGKIGLSNIIQQAYSTVEGQLVSNVDFSRNTVADYTTIPSMDVFKKFIPQIHNSYEIEYAISSYGRGVFESQIGLSSNKIPTVGNVINLIKASNSFYIPPLINDSGDYTHVTLTQAVFSANYIDKAVFGAGGYGEFPKSSMKSYVDDLSTRVFTIDVNTSDGMHETEAFISNSAENIASIVTGIEEAITNNHPFIIAIKVQGGVLIGNVTMWESDYTNISAHSNQYDIYIHLVDEGDSTVTMKRADVSKAESEKCILVLEDVNDYPQVINQFNRRSNAYDNIGVLDAYDIFLNNGSVPLKYNGRIYQPSSVYIRNSDNTVIVQYVDFFDIDRVLEIHISDNNVAVSRETPSRILGGTILENGLYVTDLDVDMPDDSHQTASIPSFLGNLYDMKIDNILIGGTTVSKDYDSSLKKFVDLTDSLKQFCIWDNPDTMLAKLQNLNTSAADAYKYDFSGDGSYNVSTDFTAYQNLRDNLVLEVNGLRKKLANINVGTTYATQTALDTLAGKVYAGLYGNDTGTNTLADSTKLQSLKAVVDFIGLKSTVGSSLSGYLTNWSEGIYQTITGSDESVLYLSETQGNSGLQFVSNLDSLGHILGSASFYTKEGETSYTPVESMDMVGLIGHEGDSYIMTAGGIEKLVGDITGFNYSYVDFSNYDTIKDRLESLEDFKEVFDAEGFIVADVLESIGDLNRSVSGLSGDLTTLEGTVSTLNGAAITGIKIKATDGESSTYAEVDVTKPAVSGVADLTSLATKGYVNNAISNIESLGNLTPEDLDRLDALADNISKYALLSDVTGMLTKVKIGTLEADISTTPGTAAFSNINAVKQALGLSNVLTSSSSISSANISWVGGQSPIYSLNDDDINERVSRLGYLNRSNAITSIKFNGTTNTSGTVNLGTIIHGVHLNGTNVVPLSGIINLENIALLSDIPVLYPMKINGQVVSLNESNEYDFGDSYVTNEIMVPSGYDIANNESTNIGYENFEESLVTMDILTRVVDYYLKPDGEGYVGVSNDIAATTFSNSSSTSPLKVYPNKIYRASTSLAQLYVGLVSPTANNNDNSIGAVYTLRFRIGDVESFKLNIGVYQTQSNNFNVSANIKTQEEIRWKANTEYEVAVLFDGLTYSVKVIPLVPINLSGNYAVI